MCRKPRSRYRQPVRHGTPVITNAARPPTGGGPTVTSTCSSGSYQWTPAGVSPGAPCGTDRYTSSGKRAPADPAARSGYSLPSDRRIIRVTPADRYSNGDTAARSNGRSGPDAVPASTSHASGKCGIVQASGMRGKSAR